MLLGPSGPSSTLAVSVRCYFRSVAASGGAAKHAPMGFCSVQKAQRTGGPSAASDELRVLMSDEQCNLRRDECKQFRRIRHVLALLDLHAVFSLDDFAVGMAALQ